MKMSLRRRSRIAAALAVATLSASFAASIGSPAQAAPAGQSRFAPGRYIITFVDDPVASYDGSVAGFPATRPAAGTKINPNSAQVKKWQQHLTAKHDRALTAVGATKFYDYTATNNGVAADLTSAQAEALSKMPDVLAVSRDELRQVTTTYSPEYLGLTAPGGLWDQLGGQANAGAGVVVGVLDTGIWPENPSFAATKVTPPVKGWNGKCQAGENFPVSMCNSSKLVGARYYVSGFGKKDVSKDDYLSPRDGAGHGSHTSATAAGNAGVQVTIDGKTIGTASGMAPAAAIAMYKVCWEARPGATAGCATSDSVAAINQAVLDGVDVLNYSIGGSTESGVFDPVAQAFRGASNAGVFVANSAGNSGPAASTLDHPAPWVTTVAAATFRMAYQVVELGNGARYVGASTTDPLPSFHPIVNSSAAGVAGAPANDVNLCFPGTLDPIKVAGKIVVCVRGVNARIDKSFEVKRAGGAGMVLVNPGPNSLNGDYHAVPSVHLDNVNGAAVTAYANGADATAKIVPLTAAELASAPQVPEITDFSSRGPSTTTDGDILKPDIAAPGNDVVAAVAPPSNHGRMWDFMSGTSMSSPHIAGIGALMKALHPEWLPSEIKSAMMTSARDTVSSADDPFAQGAGFVNPNGAADPGLVYPTTANEYRGYLVSLGARFAPPYNTLEPITASNLNQASIAIGKLAGIETVTRRVKNVGNAAATYTATANVNGFDVAVSPSTLTLEPGAEGQFTVTFTRTDAALGAWAKGSLTWTDGTHRVRSPIALQPVTVSAPTEVTGSGASGSASFDVVAGSTGTMTTSVAGLVGVTPTPDSVASGPFDLAAPAPGAGTKLYQVEVPAGTKVARFSEISSDSTADLDMFVYFGGQFLTYSASAAASEQVTLIDPQPGTYDVYVNGFTTPGGSTAYTITNFVVPNVDAANLAVSSNVAATVGQPVTLTAAWSALDTSQRWLGLVSYVIDGTPADDVTLVAIG